jgi:ribonuclease E
VTAAVAETAISAHAEADAHRQAERATAAVETPSVEAAPAETIEAVEAPAVETQVATAKRSIMPEVEVAQFDANLSPFERQVKAAAEQVETPVEVEAPAVVEAPSPVSVAEVQAPVEAPKAPEVVVETPVYETPVVEAPVAAAPVAAPVVETPVETAAPEIVAAPVAAEPAPAPAETPALPQASTGRAPNDPREVRRRRLEAERLQKEAEANAAGTAQVAEPAATEAAAPAVEHVASAQEAVTEHAEAEENKEPKPLS